MVDIRRYVEGHAIDINGLAGNDDRHFIKHDNGCLTWRHNESHMLYPTGPAQCNTEWHIYVSGLHAYLWRTRGLAHVVDMYESNTNIWPSIRPHYPSAPTSRGYCRPLKELLGFRVTFAKIRHGLNIFGKGETKKVKGELAEIAVAKILKKAWGWDIERTSFEQDYYEKQDCKIIQTGQMIQVKADEWIDKSNNVWIETHKSNKRTGVVDWEVEHD